MEAKDQQNPEIWTTLHISWSKLLLKLGFQITLNKISEKYFECKVTNCDYIKTYEMQVAYLYGKVWTRRNL